MTFLKDYIRLACAARLPAAYRRRLQDRRLARIARHAGANVPFYRDLFAAAGLDPASVRGLDDLARMPRTRKMEYRARPPEDRLAAGFHAGNCHVEHTSGSTGIPLNVYLAADERARRSARWLLARMRHGLWPWWRHLLIGYHRPAPEPWYARRLRLHATAADACGKVARFRPQVISAYASQLVVFLLELRRRGLPVPRPRAIRTGGETLTPAARQCLERAFGAPVHDFYAAVEFGLLGTSCPVRGGFHLASDDLVVEVVKDGRPVAAGEEGDLLVTSLVARAMPLLRYEIGDVGALDPEPSCPCGHPFPRIARLSGRVEEMLVLPGGRRASPRLAAIPFWEDTSILQYRVTQRAVGEFEVDLVPAGPLDPALGERVRAYFREQFEAVRTDIRVCDRLEPDPSGKRRKVVVLVTGTA
ncbi:MAG: phenylacetate--CoA ligase family protein [Kiritimatiellae bacterium]|nr:phenylacetate--CoA ligase family protein [Kiritimatiellia bacterium]